MSPPATTKPGIHRTRLGDGIATFGASIMGGPPNTTCSEVTCAVTITRAFNPAAMTCAALAWILPAFLGKLGGLSVGGEQWALRGIDLAGIIGVVANLKLPGRATHS